MIYAYKLLSADQMMVTKEENWDRLQWGHLTPVERTQRLCKTIIAQMTDDARYFFMGDFEAGRPDGLSIAFMNEEARTTFQKEIPESLTEYLISTKTDI